ILGVVENMSTYVCPQCGHEEALFGSGGGMSIAQEYGVPLLGQLPLNPVIREDLDRGEPTVSRDPDGTIAQSYRRAAIAMTAQLGCAVRAQEETGPQIEIEE
ncbi:MAG TPA: iron-sulfur cluster carrier protein ApbC, partial [Halothiobacillaceae bacterium]|nr:iron-sulfur cluster carrier protein ApbC [Halothiobacillaceae bacterium]